MLERLKSLFRSKGVEVEYERQDEVEPLRPAGPPSGQVPPAVPLDNPAADAKTVDDESP